MRFRINGRQLYKDAAHAAIELDTTLNAIARELGIEPGSMSRLKTRGERTAASIVLPLCQYLGLDPYKYLVDSESG